MPRTHKTCFRCKAEKPITEFYVHPAMGDGRLNKCKVCTRADVKQNYEANLDYYRAYDRARGRRPGEYAKEDARRRVRDALAKGLLARGECTADGEHRGRIEAHHDDYSKPLDVRWLCKKHHAEVHTRQEA